MKLKDVYTGKIYGDETLIETCPDIKGKLEYFTLGRFASTQEVADEYKKRGLVPAHPLALAAVAEKDGRFLATQWHSDGWCCAVFGRWGGGREASVNRFGLDWRGRWLFAGVPQVASESQHSASDALPLELEINGVKYRRV